MPKINKNLKKNKTDWHPIDVTALERMEKPGYHQVNRGLTWNATPTDKAKYEICQSILGYQQDNKISDKEIGQTLGIKQKKRLECLLYCHIDSFSLDELSEYASKLLGEFELKIVRLGEEIHSISQPKVNNRSKKHI